MTTDRSSSQHSRAQPASRRGRSAAASQSRDDMTPADLQILSTEHWSLLATRSLTWNEAFSRAQTFLSVLSAAVIALALVAQATEFGTGFAAFALIILPVVLFLGVATYLRLVAINVDEDRWVGGMNRIRAAYLERAPHLERYFVTDHHDDAKGVMATAGWGQFPTLHGFVTTPAVVGVVCSVVAAVFVFLSADQLRWATPVAAALAAAVFVGAMLAFSRYQTASWRRAEGRRVVINPTPPTST